jgi:hypothetical protein
MGKREGGGESKGWRRLLYLLTQKKSHCSSKTRSIRIRFGDSGKSGDSVKNPEESGFPRSAPKKLTL